MNRTTNVLILTGSLLLYGCSVSPGTKAVATTPPTTTSPTPAPATAPMAISDNWQFSATSSSPGAQPFSMTAAINEDTPTGAMHISNPSCFDPLIVRSLAVTTSADGTTTLTATGSDGQVVTTSGSFSNSTYNVMVGHNVYTTFTGTYKVDGGCAAGDQGTVTGRYIYSIGPDYDPFQWNGTFTSSSAQQTINATGQIVQSSSASDAGSFDLTGDAKFDVACLSSGTMNTATYPSGSFILGTSVTIEFDTSSGVLNFAGTLDPDTNKISGNYTITGSSCNQSGSAVVQIPTGCPGCWD